MKIHPKTAKTILWYLDHGYTYATAAHDCSITLQSLGNYTDARTERLRDTLRRLQNRDVSRLADDRAALERIAAELPTESTVQA